MSPGIETHSVAVIGAAGYTGRETIRLVLDHPAMELVGVYGSSGSAPGRTVSGEHPSLLGRCDLAIAPWAGLKRLLHDLPHTVFLATPHDASDAIAPELVHAGVRVIDLSGAFRISDPARHRACYGFEHADGAIASEAVYGLPEWNADALEDARLVACAGCYATAVQLSLRPLVSSGLVRQGSVVADGISGVSGAGRAPNARNLFGEVSLRPYGLPVHRHEPEIIEHSAADVVFTPHLAPFERGLLATVHAELVPGVAPEAIRAAFEEAYRGRPMIRLLAGDMLPSIAGVAHTPYADLAWHADPGRGRVRVFGAIDNLLKGAASQAVQCWNLAGGHPEWLGLRGAPS